MRAGQFSLRTVWDPAGLPDIPAGWLPDRVVPFGSNSMQHGTAVFEGIRAHAGVLGPAVFRLDDHLNRLLESARLLGLPHGYDLAGMRRLVLAAATAAGLPDLYLRPVLFTPDPSLGVDLRQFRFVLAVEVWPAGGASPDEPDPPTPLRLTVSPWRRPGASCFPTRAKATGLYALSALARTHAASAGFDDAIQLDPACGRVAEATIANIFAVRDGRLLTPWLTDGLLPGITRHTVLTLAAELGIDHREGPVEVADLLAADEVFLTGTAIGLAPVAAIEVRTFDPAGPVFSALLSAFHATVSGRRRGHPDWLTPICSAPTPSGLKEYN